MIPSIPEYFKISEPPCICYSYTNTIASKLFNYSHAVKEFDADLFRNGGYTCCCDSSDFIYKPCKHVLTGNLDIIPDDSLRKLFLRGPKYREPRDVNFSADQRIIFDALEQYVITWCKREQADPVVLDDWLQLVKSKIINRIRHLKSSQIDTEPQILKDKNVQKVLENLQRKYTTGKK